LYENGANYQRKNWRLETKFNKYYCGFKYGFFNAFSINWVGTKSFAFCVKISKDEVENLDPEMTRYDTGWKQAFYYIEPGKTKTKDFVNIFELAYKKNIGIKYCKKQKRRITGLYAFRAFGPPWFQPARSFRRVPFSRLLPSHFDRCNATYYFMDGLKPLDAAQAASIQPESYVQWA
jgi:hypothetical protein